MTIRLAILTSLISRNAGGLFNSVRRLGQSLESECHVKTSVFGVEDEFTAADIGAWAPLSPQVFPRRGPRSLQYAPQMLPALLENDSDLIHVHGMWNYPSVACLRWKRKTGRPHLISPRGMLDAWALRNSSWKKKIAGLLFENAHLKQAACLHALCESEAKSIRQFGLGNPVCIVPNGVDLPQDFTENPDSLSGRKKRLLFLGRIHPKKGLEKTLDAWRQFRQAKTSCEWQLLVAGWDQGGHTELLQQRSRSLGLSHVTVPVSQWLASSEDTNRPQNYESDLVFLGPAFGQEKDQLLKSVEAFTLPSYSEGLPMAVLEAWAYRLPVLMTDECNLPEGFTADAAIRICHEHSSQSEKLSGSVVDGLCRLAEMTSDQRMQMGHNGRKLVEQRFTWPRIAEQMKEVYHWALYGGTAPGSVVFQEATST